MKVSYPKLKSIKWKNGALSNNVISLNYKLSQPIPVSDVIKGAWESNLKSIAIIAYDNEGKEYIASSTVTKEETAYMFAKGHQFMIENDKGGKK